MNKYNVALLTEDIRKDWDPNRFALIRYPEPIAEIQEKDCFVKEIRNVLDMPIKIPGSDVRIPEDLQTASMLEIINTCLNFEKEINPNIEDYYVYVTVHHSFVEKETTQRRAGAHIDGMQGERYPEKMPVCHSYIVSNEVPTRFFYHPFPRNLCEKTQNWFYEFDKKKNENMSVLSKPFEINLMTAYSVHESTQATTDAVRTFVRLEFSQKKFDRTGNTVNPLFDLNWDYQDRSIPEHLKKEIFN